MNRIYAVKSAMMRDARKRIETDIRKGVKLTPSDRKLYLTCIKDSVNLTIENMKNDRQISKVQQMRYNVFMELSNQKGNLFTRIINFFTSKKAV